MKPQEKKISADLLKCERTVYKLKRNQEGKVESIIANLMAQKQKPQIGLIPRSQLFNQLDSFMPALKQSNQELLTREVKPEQRIDAKLEEVEDSSESSEEEEEEVQGEMVQEKKSKPEKMDEEKGDTDVLQSCDQFQFNILTYPYLQNPKKEQENTEQKNLEVKFNKVVQIGGKKEEIHEMEKID